MRFVLRSVRADVVLAVLVTVLSLAIMAITVPGRTHWLAYVLTILGTAPIVLRQRAPIMSTVVMSAALTVFVLAGYGSIPQGGIGVLVGLFSVALLRPWPQSLITGIGIMIMAVVLNYQGMNNLDMWSADGGSALEIAVTCVVGESTKRWSRGVERMAEQAAGAVAEERLRIAHELHDVLAHHLSVISLQAGLAEYVLDTNDALARASLCTVNQTSREALSEMRHMLTVLRLNEPTSWAPQPGLAELDGLLERLRATGLFVHMVVTGDPRPLPPGPDLCVYRVVQESLTNVLKHAGTTSARLTIEYACDTVTVTIIDKGAGPADRETAPSSRGIVGMRERAALYGGLLTAGRRPEGGFAVTLRLPTPETVDVG